MKTLFAAGLLILAIGYTAYGVTTLTLLTSSGRPAAGFFPLVVGMLLILSCAINLWGDWRAWLTERRTGIAPLHQAEPEAEAKADTLGVHAHAIDGGPEFGRDVLIVFGYICGFVAVMTFVGALLAMVLFMLVFLFTFNRGHPLGNLVYSLALPACLYGLFKVLLNASLPIGPLGL
ncbi:tripartite tricarboxylate transporter TctB family protein [Roseobacter sinensis]|uniref:Tripartite tricarboxylate transporter TctB family protein n=1 Tax=Roseobacter sinensis TaxID=2931391 RepID=A0ABT3BI18_9RHOB|nr:tripartite tricarboxylate transporter TctB family protein [Roseobacter sp. WL0113]MCV3272759.1 tripartite tricarboxylate transporter TctB family protein [Roseobacter sp. WL0113]